MHTDQKDFGILVNTGLISAKNMFLSVQLSLFSFINQDY